MAETLRRWLRDIAWLALAAACALPVARGVTQVLAAVARDFGDPLCR